MKSSDGCVGFDDEFILRIITEITPQILELKVGKYKSCKGMFEPAIWNSYPPQVRRKDIGKLISCLVHNNLIPFEEAGIYNNGRCNRYRRIEIEQKHLIQPD